MFAFELKKFIGQMLMPIPLTLMLLMAGILMLRVWPRMARVALVSGALLLFLTSWAPVSNRLVSMVESDYAAFDLSRPVDVVVVLGGCHSSDDRVPPAAQLCSSSLYRLVEGLRILGANPEAQLFVSGYARHDPVPHADMMASIARNMGVDEGRIRRFPEPKDTGEEAEHMKPWLMDRRFALVTEASHLVRAVWFFERQGLEPIPAPAIRLGSETPDLSVQASNQLKSERAFYEVLGMLWQRLVAILG
ncbi:ElyC/SanA/YdcF family protein [Marinobacter sp. F4216]|uniref:ElyC/SanA/YdcF family protein n=1 Tax=Marinobacter sp. F4216 TaxID=2874281 RepID=UPI001CBFFD4F|nr:ElyC/SanA/YdcF family protein [Marinobacter sp. F4216]MBZ2168266.1 YdcF family protein [Marinobacter sp. F4216]